MNHRRPTLSSEKSTHLPQTDLRFEVEVVIDKPGRSFTSRHHPFTGVTIVIQNFIQKTRDFLHEDSGPTAVEYAIMLALITAVCVASVGTLATSVDQSFETSAETIANAFGN